tara:strand:- start:274 stop:486 length:213 start_codon:yes stop_codon:yes gene_type:complete
MLQTFGSGSKGRQLVVSECPLAAKHIVQGILEGQRSRRKAGQGTTESIVAMHPVEVVALAMGVAKAENCK